MADSKSDTPRTDDLLTGKPLGQMSAHYTDVVDFARQLERELAAEKADAERYRWWRNNFGVSRDGPGTWQLYTIIRTKQVMTEPEFDAAIDAARSAA